MLGVTEAKSTSNGEFNVNSELGVTSKKSQEELQTEMIDNVVENVFHFTINANAVEGFPAQAKQLVYLEELAEVMKPRIHIDLEALEQALFERLLLPEIEASVIPKNTRVFKEHVIQKQVFPYLFSSIQNLSSYEHLAAMKPAVQKMKELIFRNAVTALKQPALFEGQDFAQQVHELLQHVDPQSNTFFIDVVRAFVADGKITSVVKLIYNCFLITACKLGLSSCCGIL